MASVYAYDNHSGFDDMMFLTDHELSDIERFCPGCEEWDTLTAPIEDYNHLVHIMNEHGLSEDSAEYKLLTEQFYRITDNNYSVPTRGKEEMQLGLFFYIEDKYIPGEFAFNGCKLSEAETYGDFLIYPKSHLEVWDSYQYLHFKDLKEEVDFDYYPRGRVVYNKPEDTFVIYYDVCVKNQIHRIADYYKGYKVRLELDEHYCCHICNSDYVVEAGGFKC